MTKTRRHTITKTHLIIPDCHAHPDHNNDRALWLGELIADVKPDVVINIGDQWDFPSLSSYDRGRASFVGRTYKKDLDAGLDFQDKLWHRVKRRKKKQPYKIFCEGNHEERQSRALDGQPELDGIISFDDLDLPKYYDKIVRYKGRTPGIVHVDGIAYAHFLVSGVAGRPISGEHQATSLLTKQFSSCTVGHTHTRDFSERTRADGKKILGLVCGVYQDYDASWAGACNDLWWRGCVIKRSVEDGIYDPQFVSLETLRREYG